MVTALGSWFSLSKNYTNVYICGKTQAGKSSLIKRLSGRDVATGDGSRSCTSVITPYLCEPQDQDSNIVLIDSPGLCDSGGGEEESRILQDVAEYMQNQPIALFCFVAQQGVFDASVQATIRKIQYMFSQEGEDFSKFCFIITHVDVGDDLEDPEGEYPDQQTEAIQKYKELIGDFFDGSQMPQIWAISMQKFKEPKNPQSALAQVNAAKKRAADTAFEQFRASFFVYAKSQQTIVTSTRKMVGTKTLKEFVAGSMINRNEFEGSLDRAFNELEANYLADFERADELTAPVYYSASSYENDIKERLVDTARQILTDSIKNAAERAMSKQQELFTTSLKKVCEAIEAEIPADLPSKLNAVYCSAIENAVVAIGSFFQIVTGNRWRRSEIQNKCAQEMAKKTRSEHSLKIAELLAEFDERKDVQEKYLMKLLE